MAYRNDPKEIVARFDSVCAETGAAIKKGDKCIYYPSAKKCYSLDSNQATEYREWRADCSQGYSY